MTRISVIRIPGKCFLFLSLVFISAAAGAQAVSIIPYPLHVWTGKEVFTITAGTGIYHDASCAQDAEFLQGVLRQAYGIGCTVRVKKSSHKGIFLSLEASLKDSLGKEGYILEVHAGSIRIRGAAPAGVFYGIQSLRQLIRRAPGKGSPEVPGVVISDRPRFSWRAFMLDEGRYFKGEKVVRELLDEMALLKMNVFHWHLTDDQGWRIEIKKYPRLTTVGSVRRESEIGGWGSTQYDGKTHAGFYTQAQIREMVRYAAERHITIVPEIEMPGHASAAIAAYPWLGAAKEKIEVPVKFGTQYNVYNVADPRVIRFIHEVLEEVMGLFPSKVIHIGGDEVKYDQWKNSPEVQAYMKQHHLATPADLQISFTNAVSHFLEKKRHRMMGWNEIMGGKTHDFNDSKDAQASRQLSSNVIVQFWIGDPQRISEAAEQGYDVVNSYNSFTYLDHSYDQISLEKAYSFDPVPDTLPAAYHHKILGFGCEMWGEWIPTVAKMDSMIYPRIAAYAEVGWTAKSNKDFDRFSRQLPRLEDHWKEKGILFPPSPR